MKSRSVLLLLVLALAGCLPIHGADHKFGWIGDSGNKPATPFNLRPGFASMPIAPSSDLTPDMPPIPDQGPLGSCTGNGVGHVMDFASHKQGAPFYTPSRLLLYYNGRSFEGTTRRDTGCQIIDVVKGAQVYGACPEKTWPYVVRDFAKKPSKAAYAEAAKHQAIRAYKVDNTDGTSIRRALSGGFPVVFGALVYQGIERVTADNPVLPMPAKGERPIGGHCMTISGHNDATQLYTVDNSWGTSYGKGGRLFIPYAYIHNGRLTEDCWVIDQMETP